MNTTILLLSLGFLILFAMKPIKFKYLTINMVTGSFFILAILFMVNIVNIDSIMYGILGTHSLHPWKIIIIFFTVAYASVSTDITGVFDVIAHRIIKISHGNTMRLFTLFYIFASVLTIFTSNDIVILTLTPIILYLGKYAKLNIIPFLFAEFFAANTASMMLYIGNPTNIVISEALNFSFLSYFEIMFIPTSIAIMLNYFLLKLIFSPIIKHNFIEKKNTSFVPQNYIHLGLSFLLMVLLMYTLFISDFLPLEIWEITSIFCILFLIKDIVLYFYRRNMNIKKRKFHLPVSISNLVLSIKNMPWGLAPFIFVLFVIVYELSHTKLFFVFIDFVSQWSTSSLGTILSMGAIGSVVTNIINNQPMSILFANVLLSEHYSIAPELVRSAGYALVVVSNLGANITIIGALAGLMWQNILRKKSPDNYISYWQFFKVGIIVTPITILVTLISLWIVLMVI